MTETEGQPSDSLPGGPLTIQEQVREILNALCEGAGVTETDDDDFEVLLGDCPIYVRTFEAPPAITLYQEVAREVRRSPALFEKMHAENARHIVFRIVWEDDSVFLRADMPADPVCANHLQQVLDTFEAEAYALARELEETL